jgi:hypothetical protein
VWKIVSCADFVEEMLSFDAQACLERPGRVINAGVYDLAVPA